MQTYIILTRFAPGAFKAPAAFKKTSTDLTEKLKRECPGVRWKASFATLGRYDVVDIVEADGPRGGASRRGPHQHRRARVHRNHAGDAVARIPGQAVSARPRRMSWAGAWQTA